LKKTFISSLIHNSMNLPKIILFLAGTVFTANLGAQEMSLEQVLQRVVDHYPSLKTAAIQVERAMQSSKKVDSQLGWQLGAQAGFKQDLTSFGTPTDVIDVGGSLSRTLESGSTLSIDALARKEDSDGVFSPVVPNPSTTTSIDLTYRKPLAKGSDNPLYTEGLASAKAEVAASRAQSETIYDQLASQVIDLYITAATIQVRIHNKERAVTRARRLQDFINDQANLGISEDKDVLQVEAQINSLKAELSALQTLWKKQLVSLNRLMGREWSKDLMFPEVSDEGIPAKDFSVLLKDILERSPDIHSVDARIELADSAIRTRRDEREDNIDLVLFVGNRTQEGDTVIGDDLDESEVVGGVRLEFSQSVDKTGVDAELYQAQLDRSAALQDKRQLVEDIEYELSSLLAEIKSNIDAIKAYRRSVNSEKKKLDDAVKRYRTGRTDTDQLIQFEDQLSQAEFTLELQRLELAKRQYSLDLLRGKLWGTINLPEYGDFISDYTNGSQK
jgi:outer membrane protein TolC